MQISNKAWHYRLNMSVQGGVFYDKIRNRQLTTCTYIRTTVRSLFQGASFAIFLTFLFGMALAMALNAVWVPLAFLFGWPMVAAQVIPAGCLWFLIGAGFVLMLLGAIGKRIRAKLDDRHERKLTILEQRIKDGKEGICTIVELS